MERDKEYENYLRNLFQAVDPDVDKIQKAITLDRQLAYEQRQNKFDSLSEKQQAAIFDRMDAQGLSRSIERSAFIESLLNQLAIRALQDEKLKSV